MDNPTLIEILALERLELNLFRGTSPERGPGAVGRIYGGQVIAQALLAAYATVDNRPCHSLHAYFIRPGDPAQPVIFEVDRSRDGGSFTTRRVVAIQRGEQILNLAASFQKSEEGFDHQTPAPAGPSWRDLPSEDEVLAAVQDFEGEAVTRWRNRPRPIETRAPDIVEFFDPTKRRELAPTQQTWFRARDPIGDDQAMHQVLLAYASDQTLLTTSTRPHAVSWATSDLMQASLDHAMWFHRPLNFNNWHRFVQDSPSSSGGRGFSRGLIYSEDGVLVASASQEGLIRAARPKT